MEWSTADFWPLIVLGVLACSLLASVDASNLPCKLVFTWLHVDHRATNNQIRIALLNRLRWHARRWGWWMEALSFVAGYLARPCSSRLSSSSTPYSVTDDQPCLGQPSTKTLVIARISSLVSPSCFLKIPKIPHFRSCLPSTSFLYLCVVIPFV